jgi:hypothetical protein
MAPKCIEMLRISSNATPILPARSRLCGRFAGGNFLLHSGHARKDLAAGASLIV